ncbi:MAG TPA: STAS domain-containing protein [Candidatus Eisenbacteria bacterium]|nr:STAS domain-containing protein [Candidatus Eisenbacteria bacterium]
MTTIAVSHTVDGNNVAQFLAEAREKLNNAEGEVLLDFSAVRRIDPGGLRALEDLAAAAEEKSVKVALQGVGVDVYKVLKLARLSSRFAIVN